MGEMADWFLEQQEQGGRYWPGQRRSRPPHGDVSCNRCGATGLKWRLNDADQWRLYEETRIEGNRKKQHECNPASADDFEDLS